MSKKLFSLISFVLVLALVGSASAQTPFDLQLWAEYLFDSPDPCADTGGNGYDIISLSEGATVGVVAGFEGTAYHGDLGDYNAVTDEYPNLPEAELPLEVWPGTDTGNFTIELMLYFDEELEAGEAGHVEEDEWPWFSQCPVFEDGFYFQLEYGEVNETTSLFELGDNLWFEPSLDDDWWGYVSTVNYEAGQWYHWVTSFDNENKVIRHWVDGELVAEDFDHAGDDFSQVPVLENVILGSFGGSDPLRGRIDTVRFYKGYTAELPLLPAGGVWPSNPNPAPNEDHVRPDTKICFQAPKQAICLDPNADPNLKGPFNYDVWFGTDPNVLTMKLIADGCQPDDCNDVVCVDPCAGNLAAGTTYYWRVDVNDLDPTDPCFYESVAALSFRTWGFADDESPADGEGGVKPSVILSWAEDDYAVSRDIYFDTNEAAVEDATTANTATYPGVYRGSTAPVDPCDPNRNTYDPPELLDLLTEAFWRIDEVNGTAIKGDVWSFETSSYFVVDDFEPYLNDSVATGIKAVWKDVWSGSLFGKNGAEVFVETLDADRIYAGEQSMIYYFRNFNKKGADYVGSEAEASTTDLQAGTNWTRGGAKALVLNFYGDATNLTDTAGVIGGIHQDQMYVALEDGSANVGILKYPDMNAITEEEWHEWNIELADPCLVAVDMNNVAKVYIGFGGQKMGQTAAGAGDKTSSGDTVWFDDITLHPPRCIPSLAYPYGDLDEDCVISVPDLDIMSEVWLDKDFEAPVVPPSDANLTVWYKFDNPADGYDGLSDSSAMGYHGIAVNDVNVHNGMLTLMNEYIWPTYGLNKKDMWVYPAEMNAVEIPFPNQVAVWNNSYTIFIEARTHQDNTGLAWDDVWPIMYLSVTNPGLGALCEHETTWYQAYQVLIDMEMTEPGEWAATADHSCIANSAEYGNVADANWHKIVFTYDAGSGWHYCYIDVYGDGGFDIWGENGEAFEFDNDLDPAKTWKTLIGASYAAAPSLGVIAEEGTSFMTGDVNEFRIYDYAVPLGEALALLGLEGVIYVPLDSPVNYVPKDPCDSADPNLGSGVLDPNNLDIINFRDYLVIANNWLKEILWPLE